MAVGLTTILVERQCSTRNDHDLIDEVATRLWIIHDGGIGDFQGPYEEWKGKHN
jgi:hypothetical protein